MSLLSVDPIQYHLNILTLCCSVCLQYPHIWIGSMEIIAAVVAALNGANSKVVRVWTILIQFDYFLI